MRVCFFVLALFLSLSGWMGWSCTGPAPTQETPNQEVSPTELPTTTENPGTSEPPKTEEKPSSPDTTAEATKEPTQDAGNPPDTTAPPDADLEMKAEDFGCILKWDKVNRYRITNKLGFQAQALAVANSATGGTFPVGTIIQLVPQEAMVKRRKGWNPTTNDWEFFFLKVSKDGTEIAARGKEEVKNQFGGSCYQCHSKAASQWDLICSDTHGCDPLPLSPSLIESIQNSDPRCE